MAAGLLQEHYALITGSSRGIGRAMAEVFASQGARIILTSRQIDELRSAESRIRETYGVETLARACDVADANSVASLFDQVTKWTEGRLDILVNNAGYPMDTEIWDTPVHAVPDDKVDPWFWDILRTDTMGAVYCSRMALRLMMPRKSGKILFVTSTPALGGYKGTPYTVAKAAVLGLMKDLAWEYGKYNIRSNAMALGNVRTSATYDVLDEQSRRRLVADTPLGRWGLPDEVGRVALFLASDLSTYVTGQTLIVDGGGIRR